MPLLFELPTTASLNVSDFIASKSHPSLPVLATSQRSVVKNVLKQHKRLAVREQSAHFQSIEDAILSYLPCLLALSPAPAKVEGIDTQVNKPFETRWRATLSASLPGRDPQRVKVLGIEAELAFVLSTLARVKSNSSRVHLKSLYDNTVLSSEQRLAALVAATKYLLEAHSIYRYLLAIPTVSSLSGGPVDIQASTLSGLASLTLAEANLIFVSKDDPYAAAAADDRNENNTEWMYKAPSMPKVRATLYARICIAAAEHASHAHAAFAGGKIDEGVVRYASDLRKTARAKAIRLLAVNSEAAGSTGEALAWLNAAKKELGVADADGKRRALQSLKRSWKERREDRKIEQGREWGSDAGQLEEGRICELLYSKWDKENSTINVQVVPPFEPLLLQLPSGRDPHPAQSWTPPALSNEQLMSLRAPPAPEHLQYPVEDDSDTEELYNAMPRLAVGAYPDVDKASAGTYY